MFGKTKKTDNEKNIAENPARELRKLGRAELLELMLEQSREIDRLKEELEEARSALTERSVKIEKCGSIAEAAAEVNSLFRAAQKAADMYLLNVQRICEEKAESAGASEEWKKQLREMEPAEDLRKEKGKEAEKEE